MKLLSKLTALGSCWHSPGSTSTVSEFEPENTCSIDPPRKRRRQPTTWQPALSAISEENCGAAYDGEKRLLQKEQPQRRPKAVRVRAKQSSSSDSSWRVQTQIAIPAFSPAPFMF